jgi:hypothetical protein
LFLSMFVSQGFAFLMKVRDLRRNPGSPFLRGVCVAVGLGAISAFAGIPVVLTFMETATGVPAIWLLGPLVAQCAATQATILLWSGPPDEVRRRIIMRTSMFAAAIAIMIALVYQGHSQITTPAIVANQQAPEALWGATPYLRDAVLVYFAAMIFTFSDAARQFVRNAKLVDHHWLRRGLLTLTAGCMPFLVYCLAMTGYCVALRFGIRLETLHDGSVVAVAISTVIFSAGVTMPVLGPRWDRLLAYRRLEPLWRAVRRAVPDVVLEPPWSTRIDAWNPWSLDLRLYRRVIEIRDGMLALRHYADPDVAVAARRLATRAQLPAKQVEATIEAAQLTLAIQARVAGHKPYGQSWKPPAVGSGNDLDAELTSLVPMARAFAASAIVKAVATDGSRVNGLEAPSVLRA